MRLYLTAAAMVLLGTAAVVGTLALIARIEADAQRDALDRLGSDVREDVTDEIGDLDDSGVFDRLGRWLRSDDDPLPGVGGADHPGGG